MATTIKSADRALKILRYVASSHAVTSVEIRKALEIPKSSLHGLLETMVASGFLEATPDEHYRIGLAAFEVGMSWHPRADLVGVSSPVLQQLVAQMNQIGHVGIRDDTDVIYVVKQASERPIQLVSRVGKKLPAHATALGKVLLGQLSDDEIRRIYGGEALPALTERTLTHIDELIAEVRSAAAEGYAIDRGESTLGVTCYAAPVRDLEGRAVAALSLSTIDGSPELLPAETYVDGVVRAANEVSERLQTVAGA